MPLSRKIIKFNQEIAFEGVLPEGIRIMNPFRENEQVMPLIKTFYNKYYNDDRPRHFILGINPGRFGAGLTGIPFTDPKRLESECHISYPGKLTHEPSSVFIYEMIQAYGGPAKFYGDFYISAVCPLGFTAIGKQGREVNYNYYDRPALADAAKNFITHSIETQLDFGLNRDTCICLGTGKNELYLTRLNKEKNYFNKIIALEHPRFIMQYKSASKQDYIKKYLDTFQQLTSK